MEALGTLSPGAQAIASFVGIAIAAAIVWFARNGKIPSPVAPPTEPPRIAVADLGAVGSITDSIKALHRDTKDSAVERDQSLRDILHEMRRCNDRLGEIDRRLETISRIRFGS